jgi:PAS domain S-box-containing protein
VNNHVAPTSEEVVIQENALIVSKTNLKGDISYCNKEFLRISGYTENELINHNHTIIRHPDMPRSIYRLMWNTIQKEQEFFAVIKNLCKSGAYYWTFASTSPSYDQAGNLMGYYFVRRRANRKSIEILEPLYQQMLAEEARHTNEQQAMDASIALLDAVVAQQGLDYMEFIYSHAR